MPERELAAVNEPPGKSRQQCVGESLVVLPIAKHRGIRIHCQPWLTPALHGYSANKTIWQAYF